MPGAVCMLRNDLRGPQLSPTADSEALCQQEVKAKVKL